LERNIWNRSKKKRRLRSMKLIDLTGKTFKRLTVISKSKTINKHVYWNCKCICGKEVLASGSSLKSGKVGSCGYLRSEESRKRAIKHELTSSELYQEWSRIKRRCNNSNMECYKNYGGRGISVCNTWSSSPETFISWCLANGYKKGLTLDRIDNSKGYSPDNCRWVTRKVQANNKRNNHLITFKDETFTLSEWSEKLNINYSVLKYRINNGWDVEKAFFTPINKKYSHNKEAHK
jgi:hypothetical protein